MPRLFSAIEIPGDIKAELFRLHQPLPGARWVKQLDYHITLRFFGDIDKGQTRELAANLGEIELDAFEVQISGLGAFGGNDPHNVWAGVQPNAALDGLARAHERAARNAGLPPEKRAFHPHVTLARLNGSNADAVAKFLTRFSGYRSEPFFVPRAVVMSSKPFTGGGPYTIEDAFELRGGGHFYDDTATSW